MSQQDALTSEIVYYISFKTIIIIIYNYYVYTFFLSTFSPQPSVQEIS